MYEGEYLEIEILRFLFARPLLIAALLGTVAAIVDIAPTAAVIFAGIHE